ncbi:MAG: PTS sugar transporter subunit IIA [Clostridia bacterium]|nr:PTS sugar transporter subunit IIA [Clostridia bacterium]
MNVSEVLKKEHIVTELNAKTKEEALAALTDVLCATGNIADREAFLKDVLNREAISTTGIGNGIAIPHGKSENVAETTVAVGRLTAPVEWKSVDDNPVEFIVLLAVNEKDKTGLHVKILSEMARKLASEENCKKLLNAKDADEIVSIFSE